MNFRPSWTLRGDQALFTSPWPTFGPPGVPVAVNGVHDPPKGVEPLQPALTYCHCVWLKVLKDSSRNCTVECSPLNHGSSKFFSSAISQLLRPGPVRTFRPMQPNMQASLLASSS